MKLIMKSVHNRKVKVQVQVYLSEKKKKGKILTYCYSFDRDNLKADGLGLLITFRGREFQMGITLTKKECLWARVLTYGLKII